MNNKDNNNEDFALDTEVLEFIAEDQDSNEELLLEEVGEDEYPIDPPYTARSGVNWMEVKNLHVHGKHITF